MANWSNRINPQKYMLLGLAITISPALLVSLGMEIHPYLMLAISGVGGMIWFKGFPEGVPSWGRRRYKSDSSSRLRQALARDRSMNHEHKLKVPDEDIERRNRSEFSSLLRPVLAGDESLNYVYEQKVPDEDIEPFGIDKRTSVSGSGRAWVVDRPGHSYLRCVGQNHEMDNYHKSHWEFLWKETVLTFEVRQGRTSKEKGIFSSAKRVLNLELPQELRSDRENVKQAICEALWARTATRLIKDYKEVRVDIEFVGVASNVD